MEYSEDVEIVAELSGVRFALRDGRWHPDPPSSDELREAQARALDLSVRALPSLGYTPDRVQSLADQIRDALGATIIYVRPAAEDDEMDEDIVY